MRPPPVITPVIAGRLRRRRQSAKLRHFLLPWFPFTTTPGRQHARAREDPSPAVPPLSSGRFWPPLAPAWYEEEPNIARGGEEQLDKKLDKKDPSTPVTWMEYEALRDHLTRELRVTTETFDTEIQGVNLKVDEATTAINTVQTSMTTLQVSINTLTQAVNEIRTMVQQQPLDEDDSVNGDNADAAAQGIGRGRGLPRGVNRGYVELGARRVMSTHASIPIDSVGPPRAEITPWEREMNHIATGRALSLGENYSLLIMGDNNGDEDGGGVDGDGFRGHFPIPVACRNTSVPRTWLRDGGGYGTLRGI
ncbi:hypothetical protein QYE76_031559 [Lolium multiflorum]|uniref:Uncharacterized protein n=1 Tax=Lolium multiflorum TaxID=4521 RepID=A0AAD8QTF1_LOLMU|nr:hypothetical protein QYE76_031559 [Lolium multiflorum]